MCKRKDKIKSFIHGFGTMKFFFFLNSHITNPAKRAEYEKVFFIPQYCYNAHADFKPFSER